jgi:hypothetical protein
VNFSSWLTVNAEGHALALRMQVNAIGVGTGSAAFDSAVFDTGRFAGSIDPTLPVVQVNAFNSVIEYGGPV